MISRNLSRGRRAVWGLVWIGSALVFGTGCQNAAADKTERMSQSYIWYCDGAGGGNAISNWAGGLRQGLEEAGYPGEGEIFAWNTGFGIVADQNAGVDYKRSKAADLARRVRSYRSEYPESTVTLMGLSAGTAIVVFSLEEMRPEDSVENAFLLASSVNATYDLTNALRHVDDRMYVFTSAHDGVLRHLVPIAGTADRASGSIPAAGLRGFRMPARSTPDTREQYAKLVHIRWRPEFATKGHQGGHTDVVNAEFVKEYIAPLVMKTSKGPTTTMASRPAGKVINPDYAWWARFGIGSQVTWHGHQTVGGRQEPLRVTTTLVSKHPDRIIVEWTYWPIRGAMRKAPRVQGFVEQAWIDPTDHPRTHPDCTIEKQPDQTLKIAGRNYLCQVDTADVDAEFDDWGRDPQATAYRCEDIPGGLVRLSVSSHTCTGPYEFQGEVVDYKIMPDGGAGQ